MLRASSAAHPRLHALWPTLLALLLPGYSIARVRTGSCLGLDLMPSLSISGHRIPACAIIDSFAPICFPSKAYRLAQSLAWSSPVVFQAAPL